MASVPSCPKTSAWSLGRQHPPVEHPVVRTHPETGEKVLYVCSFTTHFANYHTPENVRYGQDKTPGASMLLNYLISQAAIPEYQVRFRWKPGSVAMWDNRCTQHYAVQDYHSRRARWSVQPSSATSLLSELSEPPF